jgi:predicted nuclease with TOPRIM domain
METKVQLASIAQSEELASMRRKESRIAVIVSIIASKEKARDCKMQLLAHAEEKEKILCDIDSLNDTIDSLNDELKQLSDEKREISKIVQAVMREAEESMGV